MNINGAKSILIDSSAKKAYAKPQSRKKTWEINLVIDEIWVFSVQPSMGPEINSRLRSSEYICSKFDYVKVD